MDLNATPVSTFLTSTLAPRISASDASVTRPSRVPRASCAVIGKERTPSQSAATQSTRLRVIQTPSRSHARGDQARQQRFPKSESSLFRLAGAVNSAVTIVREIYRKPIVRDA